MVPEDDFIFEIPEGEEDEELEVEDYDDEEDVSDEEDDGEDEEDSDSEEDVLNEFEKQAKAQYAQRMEALGFKVDSDGKVVGIKEFTPTTKTVDEAVENYDDLFDDNSKLEARLMAEVAPIKIDNYVKNVVQSDSKLAKYENEVRTILSQTDPRTITQSVVENYFWWARGQNADKEIAAALKGKTDKSTDRVIKGRAAVSESATQKASTKIKDAPVTPLIAKLAKGWGVDPQKMANDQRDARLREKK